MTQKVYVGDRSQKLIYSTLPTIGKMVARIIVDPRTLNQTVVAYDGEISINETWKVAAKVTGEDFSDYPKASTAPVFYIAQVIDVCFILVRCPMKR